MTKNYYSTKYIVEKTGLKDFNLRKYIRELEDHGYDEIKRDDNNHRLYSPENVAAIMKMVELVQKEGYGIADSAVNVVQEMDSIHSKVNKSYINKAENLSNDSQIGDLYELMKLMYEDLQTIKNDNKQLYKKIETLNSENERITEMLENKHPVSKYEENKEIILDEKQQDIIDESEVNESGSDRNESVIQTHYAPVTENEANIDSYGSEKSEEHDEIKDSEAITNDSNTHVTNDDYTAVTSLEEGEVPAKKEGVFTRIFKALKG